MFIYRWYMHEYITLDIYYKYSYIFFSCIELVVNWNCSISFFQTRLTTIGEYLNLLSCPLYKNRIWSMFRFFVFYFENIACGNSSSLSSKMKTKLLFFISLACTILFRNLLKAWLLIDLKGRTGFKFWYRRRVQSEVQLMF